MMENITEAVEEACKQPTLVDALDFIAIWESERVVKQAWKFKETGIATGARGGWDTLFKHCFEKTIEAWIRKQLSEKSRPTSATHQRQTGEPRPMKLTANLETDEMHLRSITMDGSYVIMKFEGGTTFVTHRKVIDEAKHIIDDQDWLVLNSKKP